MGDHPADGVGRERVLPGRHGHRVPFEQYFALAIWLVILTAQYIFTRLVCQVGIPHDCHPDNDALEIMHDFQVMYTFGFVLAILTGVHMPDRFRYLFCFRTPRPRGVFFLVVFFLTSPVFGSLDLVPGLQKLSLTAAGLKSSNAVLVMVLLFGAVLLVLWHVWCAFAHNSLKGFVSYVLSRLFVWLFYGAYLMVAAHTVGANVHLHHYVVGFLCAILAEFNHPLSLVLLAAGTGVFVQGIAAYDADPVVTRYGIPVLLAKPFPLLL